MRNALICCAVALAVSACSSERPGIVGMVAGHRYEPSSITVSAGETVEFVNTSTEPHSVSAYADGIPSSSDYFASGGFKTEEQARDSVAAGLIKPGESFEVTLNTPGTYRYFCIPHEADGMKGTITIKP